jgi:hypothetical protein
MCQDASRLSTTRCRNRWSCPAACAGAALFTTSVGGARPTEVRLHRGLAHEVLTVSLLAPAPISMSYLLSASS